MRSAPQPERFFLGLGRGLWALVAAATAAQLFVAFTSRHEFTQAESIVLIHSRMLADGLGLYTDLNSYPYTISCYGPLFYVLQVALAAIGLDGFEGGRLISVIALAACVTLCGRITWRMTEDRWAAGTTMLLALGTSNLVKWGTTGQTDVLALAFSLAAFERYTAWSDDPRPRQLVFAGTWAALAIFTKQSFLAAAAAVSLLVFYRDRRKGAWFTSLLALAGVSVALMVDAVTGGYFDHGIRANLNPFAWNKIKDQATFFAFVGFPLVLLAFAPAAKMGRRFLSGVHVYLALAFFIFAATSGKLGSELNYQIETFAVLSIAAGAALHRLDFFRLCFQGDKSWVTLLQIPILFYLALNLALGGRTALERFARNQLWTTYAEKLEVYVADPDRRVLSADTDILATSGRIIEVEPFIYVLCVEAGLIDPQPVRKDLERGAFSTVILFEDLFAERPSERAYEIPSLPDDHLETIRRRYRLAAHIPGPLLGGVYVYEPIERRDPSSLGEVNGGQPAHATAFR